MLFFKSSLAIRFNLYYACSEHDDLPLILRYEDSSPMFDLLPQSKVRVRRASYNLPQQKAVVDQEGPEMWNTHIPDDVEEEKENSTVSSPPTILSWLVLVGS